MEGDRMATSRPVRISRPRPGEGQVEPPAKREGAFLANQAGLRRARRLFAVYGIALVAIFGVTMALAYSGPAPAAQANPSFPWGLTALTAILAVVGLFLSFGRTPAGVRVAEEVLWVRERGGRVRRFPAPPATRLLVEERYPAGWLAPEATELVRLTPPDGSPRRYVLEHGLLSGPFTPPLNRGPG